MEFVSPDLLLVRCTFHAVAEAHKVLCIKTGRGQYPRKPIPGLFLTTDSPRDSKGGDIMAHSNITSIKDMKTR